MKETDEKADVVWYDFSQRWFILMPSTEPFIFRDYQDLADHVKGPCPTTVEAARDITAASHLVGDTTGATIDDPLSDRYVKLGCSISPLEKGSDYDMIVNYLEKTHEPYKVDDVVGPRTFRVLEYQLKGFFSVDDAAGPPYDEIKKLPRTRTSNLLRHLHKGLVQEVHISLARCVSSLQFGRAIFCSDAAAEAAGYGFTVVSRTEGFLVLAMVSLGDKITEVRSPPDDTKSLEEKKMGVKGLGRKKPDESEQSLESDIKVPCGLLVASGYEDGSLEYNEYAVYDPKQVSIQFLVQVTFEPQNVRVIEPQGSKEWCITYLVLIKVFLSNGLEQQNAHETLGKRMDIRVSETPISQECLPFKQITYNLSMNPATGR
ncbi:Poly(ADP-ribose) polymerase, catalytic domain, partial [Dillenia turbinata]